MIHEDKIHLLNITGVSPLNMRYAAEDEDVSSLACSIRHEGLLQALTLKPTAHGGFEVLAGARRYRALRQLVESQIFAPDHLIKVNIFTGDDGEAALLSIVENLQQKNLHPVDQYEAYVRALDMGSAETDIIRTFGLTKRQFDERLALGRLSPKVRDLWRKGKLNAERAKLFTLGTIDEQDALLAEPFYEWSSPQAIRAAFKKTGVPGDDPRAIYVGIDAYQAAGGEADVTIFETFFKDAKLLDRLVAEKLGRAAEAVAAVEGWGIVLTDDTGCVEARDTLPFTDFETARLQVIETIDADDVDDGEWVALEREEHEITQGAVLRAIPDAARGNLALYVELHGDGAPLFTRGLMPAQPKAPKQDQASSAPRKASSQHDGEADDPAEAEGRSASAETADAKPSKRGREVLDAAIAGALRDVISGRPDLALMVLLIKMTAWYGGAECIDLTAGIDKPKSTLLQQLMGDGDDAFMGDTDHVFNLLDEAPNCDIAVALAELVGHAMKPARAASLASFDALMRVFADKGAALRTAFLAHFDYDAYFEAATKPASLAVLDALQVVGVERGAKKDVLAGLAAREAKARQWLPQPLSDWASVMPCERAAAEPLPRFLTPNEVRLQERRLQEGIKPFNPPPSDFDLASEKLCGETKARIVEFIAEACDRDSKLIKCRIEPDDLYDAFITMCRAFDWPKTEQQDFNDAVIAAGFPLKPFRGKTYFSGLTLRVLPAQPKDDAGAADGASA